MKVSKAAALGVQSCRASRQRHAFDANIARTLGKGKYLRGDRALAVYEGLSEAIEVLSDLSKEASNG